MGDLSIANVLGGLLVVIGCYGGMTGTLAAVIVAAGQWNCDELIRLPIIVIFVWVSEKRYNNAEAL